jgi:hypothetical protein
VDTGSRGASSYFRNKKRQYLKNKINKLELKWGYQLRSSVEKDEKGDLLADSHNILNM